MSAKWIEYKGKAILYIDFQDQDPAAMILSVKASFEMIESCDSNSILVLANVANSTANENFWRLTREQNHQHKHRILKGAVVGVHGIKRILLNSFNLFEPDPMYIPFETEAEAFEYLIKE